MRTISPALVTLIVLTVACKKNTSTKSADNTPPLGITAMFNGVKKTFNVSAAAYKVVYPDGVININADGYSSTNEEISIGVDNYNGYSIYDPIVEGKYVDTAFRFEVEMIYWPDGSIDTEYDEGGNNYDGWGAGNPSVSNHLQVTVTTLNDSAFIGTFTGNMYPGGMITNPPVLVTDGTFNVRFNK